MYIKNINKYFQVINNVISKDLKNASNDVNNKTKQLREERLKLIKEKIRNELGEDVNLDFENGRIFLKVQNLFSLHFIESCICILSQRQILGTGNLPQDSAPVCINIDISPEMAAQSAQ